jgi:hypothetical protein
MKEIDEISAQMDVTTDEAEKARLRDLYIAKSQQLSSLSRPISVAPPQNY